MRDKRLGAKRAWSPLSDNTSTTTTTRNTTLTHQAARQPVYNSGTKVCWEAEEEALPIARAEGDDDGNRGTPVAHQIGAPPQGHMLGCVVASVPFLSQCVPGRVLYLTGDGPATALLRCIVLRLLWPPFEPRRIPSRGLPDACHAATYPTPKRRST